MKEESFREQLEKAGGRLRLTMEGHEPLQKVFSESARESALNARRQKAQNRLHTAGHRTVGSENATEETKKALLASHASVEGVIASTDSSLRAAHATDGSAGEWSKIWKEGPGKAMEEHGSLLHQRMLADPGFARDMMETHASGLKGVDVEHSEDGVGRSMYFHDRLYGATGVVSLRDKMKRGHVFDVEMTSADGVHSVKDYTIEGARMKMKRLYYGAKDPNKTLREQGIAGTFGVGRNAKP